MRTLSRILGTGLVLAGSLSMLTGCDELKKLLGITTQKTAQQATGKKNAYDEAEDITKKITQDPWAFASGEATKDVPATQLPARTEKALVLNNQGLESYFFQRRELDGFSLSQDYEKRDIPSNPYTFSQDEMNKSWAREDMEGLNPPKKSSVILYNLGEKSGLDLMVLQFDSSQDSSNFFKNNNEGLPFLKDNVCVYIFPSNLDKGIIFDNDFNDEQDKTLFNSLRNYARRINPDSIMVDDIKMSPKDFITFLDNFEREYYY